MDAALQRAQSLVGTSAGRPSDDFYPTPPECTIAILERETLSEKVWEPACGDGAISEVLKSLGHKVRSSDLYDHGYGKIGIDFLEWTKPWTHSIVTNPPFKLAEEFVEKSMELGCDKLIMFSKLAFLEGQKRSRLLESTHLKYAYVFRKRVQLTRNGLPYKNGGMIPFAWYVWERGFMGEPIIRWI